MNRVAAASLFLFVRMKLQHCYLSVIACLLLAACQPELVLVEVTREVFRDGMATAPPPPVVTESIEVTRVVMSEVTRVVEQVVTTEVMVEVTPAPPGTTDRPFQLLFAPVADTAVISTRSVGLIEALEADTGQQFEMGVLDSEQAVIDLMCAAPVETIGFLTAVGYILAHEQCGVQVAAVAQDDIALTWQMGMIVVRDDSEIESLADLADKRGAVPDLDSIPNALYVQAMLQAAGVETAELSEIPSDSSTMLAVLNGDVDFATATFLPPLLPYEEREWRYGVDDPELWREVGALPRRSPLGYVLILGEPRLGGYRVRDARSRVFDIEPAIFNETRILTVTAPIPNETIAFGADFPLGMARQVVAALGEFAADEACAASLCSTDFYNWTGIVMTEDSAYEPLRFLLEEMALTEEDLLVDRNQ
jgi:phosphonate transport system substrate-binding protein